jgi:hypothetical protein
VQRRLAIGGLLLATTAGVVVRPESGTAAIPRDVARVERSGPVEAVVRCAGRWAPIQAKVSGFVVGNCRGGSVVRVIAVDICAPGCVRGAETEGRAWAAVSPPAGGRYRACGWMNVRNRLVPSLAADRDPAAQCGALDGPDVALPQGFIKRDTGRSVGGAPAPRTVTYRGLYLWGGRFHSGPHRGREGGAIAYRPRLGAGQTCPAYANVDPTRPGGKVSARERMWVAHDRSKHLQIRYIARFRARDEQGRLRWWVNAHSTHPADRDRPWGFVSAECLFAGDRARGADHRPPRPVTPNLQRIVRHLRSPGSRRCDFAPVSFHRIVATHGMGCARAKKELRRLRDGHALAPIACARPRRVHGWRLVNLVRDPSLAVTRYSRSGRSFDFQRHQFPGNIWCPAPR